MANITAWVKKVWKDRKTEYPTRRTLTKTNGSQEIVTVARNEGNVSQEGDAFSAANMNDLEERIDAGFTEVNGKLSNIKWKLLGSVTGKSVIDLPSDFTELLVEVSVANRYCFTFNIIKDFLTDDVKMYTSGNHVYYSTYQGYQVVINATNSYVALKEYKASYGSNVTDYTASAITKIYYK